MIRRVVVTGMGVVAPNATCVPDFETALREGRSGIRHLRRLEELNFSCCIAGVPRGIEAKAEKLFSDEQRIAMNSNMTYACVAAVEAWRDAGFAVADRYGQEARFGSENGVDWDCGAIIGSGIGGIDTIGEKVVPLTDAGKVRRLGSTCVEQVMSSNVSAKVGGLLGLGNQVSSNSSACTTGTEAICMAFERIRRGDAERMLAGASEGSSHYIWAGFDAMRVLARGFNNSPESGSRPMSASAAGFVPGAGAGILLLEDLDSARARGARIHAEIAGVAVNSGGQRGGGSMTAPNPEGVRRCIRQALADAQLRATDVGAISGHLTATMADPVEIRSWAEALNRHPSELPPITATKSLIGHALGAAGAIESVAAILMLRESFVHASLNCEDLHPDIEDYRQSVVRSALSLPRLEVMLKAGFGFGDVNACLCLKRWALPYR